MEFHSHKKLKIDAHNLLTNDHSPLHLLVFVTSTDQSNNHPPHKAQHIYLLLKEIIFDVTEKYLENTGFRSEELV